jgi:hypothetical protein
MLVEIFKPLCRPLLRLWSRSSFAGIYQNIDVSVVGKFSETVFNPKSLTAVQSIREYPWGLSRASVFDARDEYLPWVKLPIYFEFILRAPSLQDHHFFSPIGCGRTKPTTPTQLFGSRSLRPPSIAVHSMTWEFRILCRDFCNRVRLYDTHGKFATGPGGYVGE